MTTGTSDPDARLDALRSEALRLASSGSYATWEEVRDGCVENGMSAEDARDAFASPAFREEIEELAESAHGIGGPATS